MDDLQVDQSGGQTEISGVQDEKRLISNIIKNFKGFNQWATAKRRDFDATSASKLNGRNLTLVRSNTLETVSIAPQEKDGNESDFGSRVKVSDSNLKTSNSPNSVNNELPNENPDAASEPKKGRKMGGRILNAATLSPFASRKEFFEDTQKRYTDLRRAYVESCGREEYANQEILRVIDFKLRPGGVNIECSNYWQRRAESKDFRNIVKMCNLDLCGGSLHLKYYSDCNGSGLPKEGKAIFDKAVNNEKLVNLEDFEHQMDGVIESYNKSVIDKLLEDIDFDESYAETSDQLSTYLDTFQEKYPHKILDEEAVRKELKLETGFINKDISKLKEGLGKYPELVKEVNDELIYLKTYGKSSSLRTKAKRIMNRAYQIKAQLDEVASLHQGQNGIAGIYRKELENKLIGVFRKSADNNKNFTSELNKIKAEINKGKVLIENENYIKKALMGLYGNFESSKLLENVGDKLRLKLGALTKDGSVELSKNKDAEKLIKRAERVADEIKKLEESGLEEVETEASLAENFEKITDNLDGNAQNFNSEDQNSVKKTKKDEFKEQLEDVFENHANEKDFDRALNEVLVGINQAKMFIDNKKFIEDEVGKFDKEVNGFYAGISDNQDDNENQALERGDKFGKKILEEALSKFAKNKKGEVVKLSGKRDAAGATGVLNRAKQITDTLKSLRNHPNKGELSAEERKGFVDELNELYSELATAKGFGRKLKGIEAKINEAVTKNVAKAKAESTKNKNEEYINTQISDFDEAIGRILENTQEKHEGLGINLKDATAEEGGLKEIFQSKLKALNDGSIDFEKNTSAKNNIQHMYDKTMAAVMYLKHIESGRNRGLLTDEEYSDYKKKFKEKLSDSLEKPRESAAAFEARLGKIYAGAKKLRKERISNAYDNRIGEVIRDIGLHLQLSQVKNFAKAVFKADGITSEDFSNALTELKKKVLGQDYDEDYYGDYANPLKQEAEQSENPTEVDEEQFKQLTAKDDKGLRELLGNKARELARTHFAGGKGSRKEFENKLGVLLDRAQKIQKTINNEKKIELNEKQKQQLFKLMDVSFPKVFPKEDNGSYNDGKFKSGLEKFEMDVGIRERPKRRGLFGLRNPKEVVVEQNSTEDNVIGIYDDLGSNQNEDPIWARQSEPINDNNNQDEDDLINNDFEESWGDSVI